MDNSFNEYRRRPRVRPAEDGEKRKKDLTGVVAVQLALSLAVAALLFAVCRTDSELSQGIRYFYGGLCKNDMSVSQVLETFKKVAQFTFAPSTQWDGSFLPDGEEQTEGGEPSESTTQNADPKSASDGQGEADTDKTGERSSFSPVFLTVNFINPLKDGKITSRFGYRTSPITGEYTMHNALDIAAPEGSGIYSAFGGVAEKAGSNAARGNYVVIRHSKSLKTTYSHCSKLLVREGERVRTGERIALVGSTGASTGSHLHFEVLLNGKYINPRWVVFREL